MQQAQIEIAAVHHEVELGESVPEGREIEVGCEGVHEVDFAVDIELEQAEPDLVVKHVVRLGIEEDLVDAVEGGQERSEGARTVEQLVVSWTRRMTRSGTGRGGGRGGGGLDAEKAANGRRQ
jgi:hypothetical protein